MKRLLLLAPVLALSMVPMNAQGFPEGPGKSVFENTCGGCHGADIVIGQTGTREVWQDTVDSMRGRGALGTDDDFKLIVNYLSKYFGVPVNVNTAPAKDLESLDLTTAEAAAVVKYRTDKGKIKDWADFAKIEGVDAKKVEPIKSRLKF